MGGDTAGRRPAFALAFEPAPLNEASSPVLRCVRLRTDVAGVPKVFDYIVPARWAEDVRVGARVRVELHGRRVGGWVVEDDVTPPEGVELRPLKAWSGWGPPPSVVDLARWAAWRWAGPISFFLGVGSPRESVRRLPAVPVRAAAGAGAVGAGLGGFRGGRVGGGGGGAVGIGGGEGAAFLRLAPTTDLLDVVLAVVDDPATAARPGGVLVVVPGSVGPRVCAPAWCGVAIRPRPIWAWARAGWPIVVGSRAAAWAPLPRLAAAVVLDAHDESYREESAPTYSAVDVITERARRDECPCILTSPCPPVVTSAGRSLVAQPAAVERAGLVHHRERGSTGGGSTQWDVLRGIRPPRPLRARRSRCHRGAWTVGVLLRPDGSGSDFGVRPLRRAGAVHHVWRRRGAVRIRTPLSTLSERAPLICAACGRMRMKTLRAGVTRLREELAALLGVEVGEVSGASKLADVPPAPVLIGTEAVLHRIRRAAAVVFLDIDLHLLAPRFSATDETLSLLVHASRLVGPRRGPASARVLVQTRVPDHPVLLAVARGELADIFAAEESMRASAGLPPFSALAAVSGPLANGYVDALRAAAAAAAATGAAAGPAAGPAVTFPRWATRDISSRLRTHAELCDLLASVARPPGRGLRVEVDPAAL